jgi:excinuclease ABC subunit C
VAALKKATSDEIAAVPGIGPKSAESIVSAIAVSEVQYLVDTATGEIIENA